MNTHTFVLRACIFLATLSLAIPVMGQANFRSIPSPGSFDIGIINDVYVIDQTQMKNRTDWYKRITSEYYQGEIPYKNWKNRQPPLPFNYTAEIIKNADEDITTDAGRSNLAKFIPAYRFLIEHSYSFHFGTFKNIELLFDRDTLISFIANVDTSFSMAATRRFGKPSYQVKIDTVTLNNKNTLYLYNRKYTWQKDQRKIDIVLFDVLNEKGFKKTYATMQMMNTKKYDIYKKKVAQEKQKLDREYAKSIRQ